MEAKRFVQLLPKQYADVRTYNMLVSVCAAAGDLRSGLQAADMLRASGAKPDCVMYTNLIKGERVVLLFLSICGFRMC
jgi:pentatricopeptide repeat protein